MSQKLEQLTIHEVSLVDRPANSEHGIPRARIAIYKRDDTDDLYRFKDGLVLKKADGVKYVVGFQKGGDSSKIQSVLFDQEHWTEGKARKWLKDNNLSPEKSEITKSVLRFRQADPEGFDHFRTITPGQDNKRVELQPTEKGDVVMTLQEIQKKVEEQDELIAKQTTDISKQSALLTNLQNDSNLAKAETEMVLKMSKNDRELYSTMDAETRKTYMAADVTKQAALMDVAAKAKKEKALKDSMSETCKAEFEKAGPVRRAQMILEAEKAATHKKAKPANEDEEDDEDDKDEEDDDKEMKKMVAKAAEAEMQKLVAKAADSEDRLAKAESELVALKKRDRLETFAKRAESELPNTPGSPDDKGNMIMKLADTFGENSEDFKKLFNNLKEADKALGSRFHEVGKQGGAIPADAAFNGKVQEIMKRDRLSEPKATEKAMFEAPELYMDAERAHRQFAAQQ